MTAAQLAEQMGLDPKQYAARTSHQRVTYTDLVEKKEKVFAVPALSLRPYLTSE